MNRDEIIIRNPLDREMERRGWPVKGRGQNLTSHRCPQTEHKPQHQCMSIDLGKGLWHCQDCKGGGSIIDFVVIADGISPTEAMRLLGGDAPCASPIAASRPAVAPGGSGQREAAPKPTRGEIVKTYDYTDAEGRMLYQVCRMDPKDFRQRRRGENGEWVWNLEGVRRVLYNLPKVMAADYVWVVEGEKDAEALGQFHFVATCNVGGAGKWSEDYTETLRDKDVILCGDNDEPGQRHMEKAQVALAMAAKTIRRIQLPPPHKDVSDFVASYARPVDAGSALLAMAETAEALIRGIRIPIHSMEELEAHYKEFARNAPMMSLRLGDWLPSLGSVRPLVPGEVATIIAGTGVGKTMLLQNIALHTRLTTLLFEMELPGSLSFERFAAMAIGQDGSKVFDAYYGREEVNWRGTNKLDHIHVCSEPRMSPAELERIILCAGLKIGLKPVVVLIDYIQLVQGKGERYDRISDAMEALKIMAKATGTIVIIASQIARKDGKSGHEVSLSDGKESGSIENSSGLVLGAWRDEQDGQKKMWVKILKNTKGNSGKKIPCKIGSGLVLTELAETQ